MASQGRQAINRLSGMFPNSGGRGLFTGAGALIVLSAAGLGINASLFNGIYFSILNVEIEVFFKFKLKTRIILSEFLLNNKFINYNL